MDAAAVTSSLQSFHGSATAVVDSRLSASHHSSSAASEEEDIVQATSALLQDLDQPSALSFSSYMQSSVAHAVVHGQAAVTPQYDVRKDLSPFSPVFLKPGSNSSSPQLMTAESITMAGGKDCMPSLSQHISASPGGIIDGHRALSDPLSHFISCDAGATSVAEIEAAFSGAFKDASQPPYFQSPELLSSDHLTKQMKSPSAYQSISSAQQIPGIAISAPESHGLQGVPMSPSGVAAQPVAKAEHLERKPAAPPPPPKKPLSPYMRFSKGVWQKVKAEHPGMSVCEVGARIGRFWRELSDSEKQHYVEEFNIDKARYDGEFQNYLRVTGLQASDLVKPRAKKKDAKDKQTASRAAKRQESQTVSSAVPPEHEAVNQESSTKPPRQANDVQTMVSNGQQNTAFLVNNHPENGVKPEGVSSLPPFSQVWSNSEIMTGQDLLLQMVLGGQHRQQQQQQQQQQQVQSDATRTSLDGSSQHLTKSYGHGMVASYEQQAVVQQPSASLNCASGNQTTVALSGHSDMGGKGWPWQQVTVSLQNSQSAEPSNEGVLVYQLPTNGIWSQNSVNSMAVGQSDQNGSLVLRSDADAPMMSTMQVSYSGGQDGINCVFQMAPSAVCTTNDDGKRGIVVDPEKLQLRNALLEKSEEVLRLMKELEQAYSLIHQLKQQNDFFHQQWNLHHGDRNAAKSSVEADGGGNAAHRT